MVEGRDHVAGDAPGRERGADAGQEAHGVQGRVDGQRHHPRFELERQAERLRLPQRDDGRQALGFMEAADRAERFGEPAVGEAAENEHLGVDRGGHLLQQGGEVVFGGHVSIRRSGVQKSHAHRSRPRVSITRCRVALQCQVCRVLSSPPGGSRRHWGSRATAQNCPGARTDS